MKHKYTDKDMARPRKNGPTLKEIIYIILIICMLPVCGILWWAIMSPGG